MKHQTHITIVSLAAAAACWLLSGTAQARIVAPVAITIAAEEEPKTGKEVTVHIVLLPQQDLTQAFFRITQAEPDWKLTAGNPVWTGSLKAGKLVAWTLTYIPLVENPAPLQGMLEAPGWPAAHGKMAKRQDAPGQAVAEESGAYPAGQPPQAWETGLPVPSPEAPSEARKPGDYSEPPRSQYAALDENRQAGAPTVASGRLYYVDERGRPFGLRNATVELRDRDGLFSERCGAGTTDADGNFSVVGLCTDSLWDLPDYFVRLVLNNSVVEVKPNDFFAGSYTFDSEVKENWNASTLPFGELRVSNGRVSQLHNFVVRAWQFLTTKNEYLPKILVEWPASQSAYFPAAGPVVSRITIAVDDEWDELTVLHEYGHHLLHSRAESPAPDYNNGICDNPTPGHCFWGPERGLISWTEGFPDFFGIYLTNFFDHDPVVLGGHDDDWPGSEDRIEGYTVVILWDLLDDLDNDQHADGAGRRDSAGRVLTFDEIWDIVRRYDPSTAAGHNHPTSIHEFWDGIKALYPWTVNRAAEIFREHHIVKPQPDLRVAIGGTLPAAVEAGSSFPVAITLKNSGNESAQNLATIQMSLLGSQAPVPLLPMLSTGGSFSAGGAYTWNISVAIPAGVPPGSYRLQACADVFGRVPESDENNNCATSTAAFAVSGAYPVTVQTSGGYYLTAMGGGGRLTDVLHSDARFIGTWERFSLVQTADNQYALKTVSGHYLTFVGGGGRITDVVHSDATALGAWEKFTLISVGGGQCALRTATGNLLTAIWGGGRIDDVVHTDARVTGLWERFRLAGAPGGICQ